MEGYDIIDTANLVFGFGCWGYEVKEIIQVSEELNQNQNRVIGYRATISLRVHDASHKYSIVREDIGFGTGIAKDYANAYELSLKEAVTDGLKRVLRSFGNQFGNALYDKSMKNVDFNNQAIAPPQNQQSSFSSDPYASLYPLGLGVKEQNGKIIVTGSTYGKQQTIKELWFQWDVGNKTWYKQLQQVA